MKQLLVLLVLTVAAAPVAAQTAADMDAMRRRDPKGFDAAYERTWRSSFLASCVRSVPGKVPPAFAAQMCNCSADRLATTSVPERMHPSPDTLATTLKDCARFLRRAPRQAT